MFGLNRSFFSLGFLPKCLHLMKVKDDISDVKSLILNAGGYVIKGSSPLLYVQVSRWQK